MIIVMCGLPKSGKSVLVDQVFSDDEHYIVRPSAYIPENVDNHSDELQRQLTLEAWRTSLDLIREQIHDGESSDVIVFDACNKSFETVRKILDYGMRKGHWTVLLYVNAPTKDCRRRGKDLNKGIFANYIRSLKESLPNYKRECDQFLVVDNKGSLSDLAEQAVQIRDKLCLNTLIPTHTT